jgi:PAS domain S-box-containing protein
LTEITKISAEVNPDTSIVQINQLPVAIMVVSGADYHILSANKKQLEVLGKSGEEIGGKPLMEVLPQAQMNAYLTAMRLILQTGREQKITGISFNGDNANNAAPKFNVHFSMLSQENAEPAKFLIVATEADDAHQPRLTDLPENELLLTGDSEKKYEELYRSLFQKMDQGFCIAEIILDNKRQPIDYRFLECNQVFEEQTGLKNATNKTARELVPGLEERWFRLYGDVALTGKANRFIEGSDAMKRWFEVYTFRIGDESSLKIAIIFNDITAKRLQEEALRESEQRYRNTFINMAVGIAHVDIDGKWISMNDKLCEIVGYSRDELIHKTFQEITVIEDLEKDLSLVNEVLSNKRDFYTLEKRYIHKTGNPIWVNLTVSVVKNDDGSPKYFISLVEDIGERKRTEQALKESEAKFRTLSESLPQMIWINDAKGKTEYTSASWKEYSGVENIEEAWIAMVHPDDFENIERSWREQFPLSKPFYGEVRLKNKSGEYRWHSSFAEPVKNEAGEVIKWVGALTDIHDPKTFAEKLEREVHRQTEELRRSNDDLQQYAHVASHDLKEPVRKIRLFSDRLLTDYKADLPNRAKEFLNKIETSAKRIYHMIDSMFNYSNVSNMDIIHESVDLSATIENIKTDLELVIQEKQAQILYDALPTVEGSQTLLYQLLYNLIVNSLKFARHDHHPVISINNSISDALTIPPFPELKPGATYLTIILADNGIGFAQDQAERIFQTYARLHSNQEYEGSGLGLSLCKKIVQRHNGCLFAEGKEGVGARFTIILPILQPK